jgi:hypothetical protein
MRADPSAPIGHVFAQLGITKDCCIQRLMTCTEFKYYYDMREVPSHIPVISTENLGRRDQKHAPIRARH